MLLTVEGEQVMIAFSPAGARVLGPGHTQVPTVELTTTRRAILQVIDAQMTLTQAVLSDAILLKGQADDLAVFHDGLMTYVRGAVRCPSFPPLLDTFRDESRQLG